MLRPGMDHQEITLVHAMSYHLIDHEIRYYQVHLSETFPFGGDYKMESATV